jgi:hypothetical protein
MSTLHFGFEPTPYPDGDTADKIARILEDEYGIVEHFRDFNQDLISELMHEAMMDHDEELMSTGRIELPAIEDLFKQFLNSNEMAKLGVGGVPVRASRRKVKVGEYRRRGRWVKGYTRLGATMRSSFVKTGTYRDSFRAWIEVD